MDAGRPLPLGLIAKALGLQCTGDPDTVIDGMAGLAAARPGQISFLANPRYRSLLKDTRASAVILHPDEVDACPVACLVSPDPYLSYARASALFAPPVTPPSGIHPSTVVAGTARLGSGVSIGAHVVIGENAEIGDGCSIGAGCVIGEGARIGTGCRLHANVTLYHAVVLGRDVVVHSGAVIGADGFGFARDAAGWVKIHQLGSVRLGDAVEIGAGTTIDRGALDDTVIGDGVIIDNQVQIAHNVVIGAGTAIAGCAAIAGSAVIGRNCTIGGGAGIVGHIRIADNVHVTARTLVTRSIDTAGSYSSGTAMMETGAWRRSAVRFAQLESLQRRLTELEKRLLTGENNNGGK